MSCAVDSVWSWRVETQVGSPVSFRSFAAARFRITGRYVSGTVNVMRAHPVPARINWSQYNHRHPFPSLKKPPANGPITGLRNGASKKAAMASPLSLGFQRSAKVPLTIIIGTEKATPSRARHTRNASMFLASTHGIRNIKARNRVPEYTTFRPYILHIGAKTIGPSQHNELRICDKNVS
jgi:hypothetical protein